MMTRPSHRAAASLLLLALAAAQAPASADRRRDSGVLLPAYAQECGTCHVAFPPGLLPTASWQRLMDGLPRHFGVDASLDAATAQPLTAWLTAHAGNGRRATQAPPDDRITRSAWFVREHDEVPSSVWQRPAVKSAANCGACHAGAEQGDFDEHRVHIPR